MIIDLLSTSGNSCYVEFSISKDCLQSAVSADVISIYLRIKRIVKGVFTASSYGFSLRECVPDNLKGIQLINIINENYKQSNYYGRVFRNY